MPEIGLIMELTKEFDGVFRFTNPTDEDFVVLWNNKEYLFPAQSTCPMIIANESLENIQEIRKKFAYKLAVREFYKGKEYGKLSKLGGANPSTFDEKVLEPVIEMCLKPLPQASVKVKELPKEKRTMKGSKAVGGNTNLNKEFEEDTREGSLNE